MAIDYHHLKARALPQPRQAYDERDTMLYALSMGAGQDPMDLAALAYAYEESPGGLRVLPTQSVVLGHPGFWIREPDAGIDWVKVVHGEQRMRVHQPMPAAATLIGRNRVSSITDKGEGKGAIVVVERRLEDDAGQLYVTLEHVVFCRGDGGFSAQGAGQPSDAMPPALAPTPDDREPDAVHEQPIRPETALIYRLLADRNPLHADPGVAAKAGFPRPILHGLATWGMACFALVRKCAGDDPTRVRTFDARFSAPVYPGETLRTEFWQDGDVVRFRAKVVERDVVVLSHGRAELAPA